MPEPAGRGVSGAHAVRHGTAFIAPLRSPLLLAATVLLAAASVPVLLGGGPHFDDFTRCVLPRHEGFEAYFASNTDPGGAVRAAKHLETGLLWSICGRAPFGFAILVPLTLTVAVGYLLTGLLADLGARRPWSELGGVAWLLWPLGGESAWWPSALHVPFGLALSLLSLRFLVRRRWVLATLCAALAFMAVEPVIFVLPLATVVVSAPRHRRRVGMTFGGLAILVLGVYAAFPGDDVRTAATPLAARLSNLTTDVAWLVRYPVKASGLAALPLVTVWTVPVSVALAAAGGFLAHRATRRAFPPEVRDRDSSSRLGRSGRRRLLGGALATLITMAALAQIPMMSTVPRVEAPRTFAATWLILVGTVAWAGGRGAFPRWHRAAAAMGALAACAFVTLGFQSATRAQTTAIERSASLAIAERTSDGDRLALCDVPVTLVDPALRWTPYSHNSYVADYAAGPAVFFYAGRSLELVTTSTDGCPDGDFDVQLDFVALLAGPA